MLGLTRYRFNITIKVNSDIIPEKITKLIKIFGEQFLQFGKTVTVNNKKRGHNFLPKFNFIIYITRYKYKTIF